MVDIIDAVQLDNPGSALVDLFEIEVGDTTLFLFPGLLDGTDTVYFSSVDGSELNEYLAIPMEFQGMEMSSDGVQARPTLTVANIVGAASASGSDTTLYKELAAINLLSNSQFIGKKVTRRRTLAENLQESGDTAAVQEEMPLAIYIIERIESENNVVVSFELSSPFDLEGVQIPNRIVIGKYCSWEYQGVWLNQRGGCPWQGNGRLKYADGAGGVNSGYFFFDKDDRPCVHTSVTFGSYSSPHDTDDLVQYLGKKYRCNRDGVNTAPPVGLPDWQELVEYSDYNSANTYSYSPPPVDEAVFYDNRLWIPKRGVPTNTPPGDNSYYWARFDSCGKTVNSCKQRFQGLPINPSSTDKLCVPSAVQDTSKHLYFGGFPGTAKFR